MWVDGLEEVWVVAWKEGRISWGGEGVLFLWIWVLGDGIQLWVYVNLMFLGW
jgi:hypothetical protein